MHILGQLSIGLNPAQQGVECSFSPSQTTAGGCPMAHAFPSIGSSLHCFTGLVVATASVSAGNALSLPQGFGPLLTLNLFLFKRRSSNFPLSFLLCHSNQTPLHNPIFSPNGNDSVFLSLFCIEVSNQTLPFETSTHLSWR